MNKRLFSLFFGLTISLFTAAQEKRALLIAVDNYEAPSTYKPTGTGRSVFHNLDGCVNDARSIQSIVVSKFQFSDAKVDTLYNEAASRAAILKQMNDLLAKSQRNDIAFIYYAGHGSQVPNSLAKEDDKKDESMVPSDTWKEGVEDIRDKELAAVYNKFIDKGVKLTVILDCCHSGSLSRGPNNPGKFRFIEDAKYDAKDPSQPTPPESRKEGTFLIMSAAQDNEFAQEQRDEHNIPHGAFTIAFVQALEQQSVNASALNLFTSIRAILKSNGKKQEPVLGGSSSRQAQTLFGLAKGTLPDKSLIAVAGIENGKVTLQGGFALGLYKENELVKFGPKKDTLVKLRIDSVVSVNRSIASFVKGSAKDLKPGELLEVTNWVSSSAPLLKVFVPAGNMSPADITKLAAISKELQQSSKIKWVNNLEKTDPYTTVYYDGKNYHVNVDGKEVPAPSPLTAAALLQLCKQDSTFYFELPASRELADAIREKMKLNKSIVLSRDAADAQYVLYGTIDEAGLPAYGLRRAQTSSRDSLESMPVQTRSFGLDNSPAARTNVADSLYEYAMRLSKIRGWQQLTGPKDGNKNFPFYLEIVNKGDNKIITNREYKVGDKVAFNLVAEKGYTGANKVKRYVYVFLIDKDGNMVLCYPDAEAGNVANQFPKFQDFALVNNVFLFEGDVSEPVGTDNYYLLASDEPISNYAMVFNQEGVRAGARGVGSPLGNLLNMGNAEGTRGFTKSVSNWNLIRLAIKSKH
ncbi:MAG: caspase family protein [Chitinophagaceae bacterium]